MEKKKLHLAQNLTELNKLYFISPEYARKQLHIILPTFNKILENGDKAWTERDEETSYVFYMKYMNLMSIIQKSSEFEKEKASVVKIAGSNEKIRKYLDRIEELQNSLKIRYEMDYPSEKPVVATTNGSSEPEVKDSAKPAEVRETVSSQELYKMMEGHEKILIMDCRPEEDYAQSKITYQYTINVPAHILKLGMSASKIEEQLPNGSKVFWQMRNRPFIIIVDWKSKRFNRNSPVWHLKEILMEWDQDIEKKPEMLLLEGGYDVFKTRYPMKCENPQYSPPRENNGDLYGIEDIEYPNLEDIQMKDSSMNISTIPLVDRSMKPNAGKAYDSKTKLELMEEKEKLVDKTLETEQELLSLETSYSQVVSDKENNEGSAFKEQKYLFQIWELQSRQDDLKVKEKSIKEQLDLKRKLGKEVLEPQQMTKVAQLEQHFKEVEAEQKRIKEEREQKKREREAALKHSRDHPKPSIDALRTPPKVLRSNEIIMSPKALDNQINKPSIPMFDRTSKPPSTVNSQIVLTDQDFAPVYGQVEQGLTGLKNLGNSCYMNSIIQCLSNTSTLTEYLLENKHEKHLNRSNKTKGHIVQTLAAVIKMLWKGQYKYISSKNLKLVIGEQDHLFYGMEQQDSHEFLIMLIDWLQSDLQTIFVQNKIETLPASEKAWLEYTKAKESFILRLFYGQIKSTVKCTVCSKESATYETFSNLSLGLPPIEFDRCDISDCFNRYFHGEMINGWTCPHCKVPRDAIKKLDISKLPPVLVIHLKRFIADPYSTSTFRKRTTYVDFPLSKMSMLPYVARTEKNSGSNSNHVYNLYAVSNHYGSMESGHYTAYCKNAKQNKWYKFDDHTVSPMDSNDVRSTAAYILFYTINDTERGRY